MMSHCRWPAAFCASIFAAQTPPTIAIDTGIPVALVKGSVMFFCVASLKTPPQEAMLSCWSAAWEAKPVATINAVPITAVLNFCLIIVHPVLKNEDARHGFIYS